MGQMAMDNASLGSGSRQGRQGRAGRAELREDCRSEGPTSIQTDQHSLCTAGSVLFLLF
jgi:hypothetical protein